MKRAGVVGILVLLASCATSPKPVVVPGDEIPFPLSRSTPAETLGSVRSEVMYFASKSRLVPVLRRVEATGTLEEAIVRVLFGGPTATERSHDLTTEIPASTRLLGVAVEGDVATVNVSEELEEPAPPDRIRLRVAQIVYTLTRLANIDGVRFEVEGSPIEVVPDSGIPTSQPIRRTDLAREAPLR